MKVSAITEKIILIQAEEKIDVHQFFHLKELVRTISERVTCRIKNSLMSYSCVQFEVENSLDALDEIQVIVDNFSSDLYHPSEVEVIDVPVCYSAHFALDMDEVVEYTGLAWSTIKERHTENYYLTYFNGFTIGFPYLGGMDKTLSTPRKSEPRTKIEWGSVGIAGDQTGVYTINSPGGWQIIGKSPMKLYSIEDESIAIPSGCLVKFYEIDDDAFHAFDQDNVAKRRMIPWPFK